MEFLRNIDTRYMDEDVKKVLQYVSSVESIVFTSLHETYAENNECFADYVIPITDISCTFGIDFDALKELADIADWEREKWDTTLNGEDGSPDGDDINFEYIRGKRRVYICMWGGILLLSMDYERIAK